MTRSHQIKFIWLFIYLLIIKRTSNPVHRTGGSSSIREISKSQTVIIKYSGIFSLKKKRKIVYLILWEYWLFKKKKNCGNTVKKMNNTRIQWTTHSLPKLNFFKPLQFPPLSLSPSRNRKEGQREKWVSFLFLEECSSLPYSSSLHGKCNTAQTLFLFIFVLCLRNQICRYIHLCVRQCNLCDLKLYVLTCFVASDLALHVHVIIFRFFLWTWEDPFARNSLVLIGLLEKTLGNIV